MEKRDDTFIFIQPSNLVADFSGNLSGTHVAQNQKVKFDAWSESFDPDTDKDNKTGITFTFFCRRSCESWPAPNKNQTYIDWKVYDNSACVAAEGSYKQKGCFNSAPNLKNPGPSKSYILFTLYFLLKDT